MTNHPTPAMLNEAKLRGMSVTQAARHFGVSRSTLDSYARRRGIDLPKEKPGFAAEDAPSETRVKAWSCRPAAIAKAIESAQARRAAMIGAKP